MAAIDVVISNIGFIEEKKLSLQTGSVNVIKGPSSSGKSSLMRGIHLGVVGRPPLEEKYTAEVKRLRLDDVSSDEALLRKGASEGRVSIKAPNVTMSATIPLNGAVTGKNSSPKGLFTTMLSDLPPTRLYKAVNDPDPEDKDNFTWVVNDLSDAGNFMRWYKILSSLNQEVNTMRSKFEEWKSSLEGAGERREEIKALKNKISTRTEKRTKTKGAAEQKIAEKLASVIRIKSDRQDSFSESDSKYREAEANNERQLQIKANEEIKLKKAKRALHKAEDLLDEEFIEPDTKKLDAAMSEAQRKIEAAEGDDNPMVKMIIDEYLKVRDSTPASLAKVIEMAQAELGDDSKLAAALSEFDAAKSERDSIVKEYLDNKRAFGMAEEQAAQSREQIKSAEAAILNATQHMSIGVSQLSMMKDNRDDDKRSLDAAIKDEKDLRAKQSSQDPEDMADQKALAELDDELAGLESSTTFAVRFTSLNALPNETMHLTRQAAEELLGTGEGGSVDESFVITYLGRSESEIRSLVKDKIEQGFLEDVSVTAKWSAEEADRQQQETRRVFNEVGTSLFNKLKLSPITGVSLNTNNKLEILDNEGDVTGLRGAGGERFLITAALLIAMRKAYTPGVPILMFDATGKLDSRPMEKLLSFLEEYAKSEDVAVVVSQFDSAMAEATLIVR